MTDQFQFDFSPDVETLCAKSQRIIRVLARTLAHSAIPASMSLISTGLKIGYSKKES